MAYDANQIDAAPILNSFLMLQANNNISNCLPSGATRAGSSSPCVPAFAASQIPILNAGVSAIDAAFVDNATVQGQLATTSNAAVAGRP